MRIFFNSMTLPKKAARRVQSYFTPPPGLGEKPKLSDAQNLTAWMLGYDTWHELEQVTKSGSHPPSPVDEESDPIEQKKRIDYQSETLRYVSPMVDPVLRQIALEIRVSAANPKSSKFSEDAYHQNAVFYWEPYGEEPEWRFRPSLRYSKTKEELFNLSDKWERGQILLGAYLDKLNAIIAQQPENISAYLDALCACEAVGAWTLGENYLEDLQAAITGSLPPEYPMKKKVAPFIWGTVDNRDFLRALYHLAQGFYAMGDYKIAKQWFLFLRRCSPMEMGAEKYFLKDIRRPEPYGDLHLMESKDIYDRFEVDY